MGLGEVGHLFRKVLVIGSVVEVACRKALSVPLQRVNLLYLTAIWQPDVVDVEDVVRVVSVRSKLSYAKVSLQGRRGTGQGHSEPQYCEMRSRSVKRVLFDALPAPDLVVCATAGAIVVASTARAQQVFKPAIVENGIVSSLSYL